MSNEIYQEDVNELVAADLKKRQRDSIAYLLLEIIILSLVVYLLGLIFMPIYFAIVLFLLPAPKIWAPTSYQLTEDGIVIGNIIIKYDKIKSLHINNGRKYVSIRRRFHNEMIKLYSKDTNNIYALIKQHLKKQ